MYELVVIGVSSGGIEALKTILPALPADFPVPLVIVQHRESGGDDFLAEHLDTMSQISVQEPEDKERIEPGHAYIAPAGYHLLLEADGCFSLSVDPPVMYARPAIDVLFESAAAAYGARVIGLILTGANSDGAAGLKAIRQKGGLGIVQNPETAHSPTMPHAALNMAGADRVMDLAGIPAFLTGLLQEKRRS